MIWLASISCQLNLLGQTTWQVIAMGGKKGALQEQQRGRLHKVAPFFYKKRTAQDQKNLGPGCELSAKNNAFN
jgi:hypothetical protein